MVHVIPASPKRLHDEIFFYSQIDNTIVLFILQMDPQLYEPPFLFKNEKGFKTKV